MRTYHYRPICLLSLLLGTSFLASRPINRVLRPILISIGLYCLEGVQNGCCNLYCYVYSLPLCYFTQSALPNYQTGCCSVLHVLLCPAKRIRQARCLFVCAPGTLLKLSSRDR